MNARSVMTAIAMLTGVVLVACAIWLTSSDTRSDNLEPEKAMVAGVALITLAAGGKPDPGGA